MSLQETIDDLIVYIDTAIADRSISNQQVATVLDYLNTRLKSLAADIAAIPASSPVTVDAQLDTTSQNPVENRAVAAALQALSTAPLEIPDRSILLSKLADDVASGFLRSVLLDTVNGAHSYPQLSPDPYGLTPGIYRLGELSDGNDFIMRGFLVYIDEDAPLYSMVVFGRFVVTEEDDEQVLVYDETAPLRLFSSLRESKITERQGHMFISYPWGDWTESSFGGSGNGALIVQMQCVSGSFSCVNDVSIGDIHEANATDHKPVVTTIDVQSDTTIDGQHLFPGKYMGTLIFSSANEVYFSVAYGDKHYMLHGEVVEGSDSWSMSIVSMATKTELALKADASALNTLSGVVTLLSSYFTGEKATKALTADEALVAERALRADSAESADEALLLASAPSVECGTSNTDAVTVTAGGRKSGEFVVPFATKAQKDEDGNAIKAAYLKKNDATFVRYDDLQELSAGEKSVARLNIDSENLVCGYYAKGFTTNIYFTDVDGGSPTRSGVVNVYRDHHNLLWSIEYPSGTTSWDVIALVATYINNVAGYSATYDLNPPTQAYHAIITITGTSEAVEDIQFQSGFTGYVFTLEVEGAAAGFYSDANFEHLLTNSYVARKLYLDLGHNTLYCGNENELQPVTGSPIVNATYDSATGNVTLWFSAETSLTIPLAGIIPTYTAGKGISIQGNAIGLNYLVVSQDEMDEYLASGVDDGIIRFVYEEEEES